MSSRIKNPAILCVALFMTCLDATYKIEDFSTCSRVFTLQANQSMYKRLRGGMGVVKNIVQKEFHDPLKNLSPRQLENMAIEYGVMDNYTKRFS
jgi:hypothetical protein